MTFQQQPIRRETQQLERRDRWPFQLPVGAGCKATTAAETWLKSHDRFPWDEDWYIYPSMKFVDFFYGKLVGKYTSSMDPMGIGNL